MKIEILSNVNVLITQILINNTKIDIDTVAFDKNILDNTTIQTNINKTLNINETSTLTYFHNISLVLKNENGKYNEWLEKINKNINLAENHQNVLETILFKKYSFTFSETLLDDTMQLELDIQYTHYVGNNFMKNHQMFTLKNKELKRSHYDGEIMDNVHFSFNINLINVNNQLKDEDFEKISKNLKNKSKHRTKLSGVTTSVYKIHHTNDYAFFNYTQKIQLLLYILLGSLLAVNILICLIFIKNRP